MGVINIALFIIMDFLGSSGKNITVVKSTDSGSSTGTMDYVSLGKLFHISGLQLFFLKYKNDINSKACKSYFINEMRWYM